MICTGIQTLSSGGSFGRKPGTLMQLQRVYPDWGSENLSSLCFSRHSIKVRLNTGHPKEHTGETQRVLQFPLSHKRV